MRRRRKRRIDPTAHIGANDSDLYDDPAEVARRNWGLEPSNRDPADVMFADTPAPVVVSFI